MSSLDEEYITFLKSGLDRAISRQAFPNLLYNDIQVSSIVYTRDIIDGLIIKYRNEGKELIEILPPKSGQTWLRVKCK